MDLGGIQPFAKRRQLMTVPTGTAIAPIALSDLACNVRKIISGIWEELAKQAMVPTGTAR